MPLNKETKPNQFIYKLNMLFVNTLFRYTQLKNQVVLFLTIQFSINQQS